MPKKCHSFSPDLVRHLFEKDASCWISWGVLTWTSIHQMAAHCADMRKIWVPVCYVSCILYLLSDAISSRPPFLWGKSLNWWKQETTASMDSHHSWRRTRLRVRTSTLVARNDKITVSEYILACLVWVLSVLITMCPSVHPFQAVNQANSEKPGEKGWGTQRQCNALWELQWWRHQDPSLLNRTSQSASVFMSHDSRGQRVQNFKWPMRWRAHQMLYYPSWVIKKNVFNSPIFASQPLVLPLKKLYQIIRSLIRAPHENAGAQ